MKFLRDYICNNLPAGKKIQTNEGRRADIQHKNGEKKFNSMIQSGFSICLITKPYTYWEDIASSRS